MNYFAHGYRFLDRPYVLAGTAVPDWLGVCDRQVRIRPRDVQAWQNSEFGIRQSEDGSQRLESKTPRSEFPTPHSALQQVAAGIVQHLNDDRWFHHTVAFGETTARVASTVAAASSDPGLRPGFVAHLLTEVLLDAALIERDPSVLDNYYTAMAKVDATLVQEAVNRIARRPTHRLAWFIDRFRSEQFLRSYRDDDPLLYRINRVLVRVSLPELPRGFRQSLPNLRRLVAERASDLLSPALTKVN